MDKGIYTAGSGGFAAMRRIDILANNIANVSTVGFKAERVQNRQQEFTDTLASTLPGTTPQARKNFERSPGVVHIGTVTDFSPGPLQQTQNPLDVALRKDNAFFVVSTQRGDAYTRAGNFTLDSQGNLVTSDGFQVQGDGGALTLPIGKPRIFPNGTVTVNGEAAGRLRIVEIDDLGKLRRAEGSRFELEAGGQARNVDAEVVPESLEMPNVSVFEAMVELMVAQKAFEAYTKTAQTMQDLDDQALRWARP